MLRFVVLALCYFAVDAAQNFTLDPSVQSLARANQEFSIGLYKQLVNPRENLIVSGFSVSTVLAMLLQGTRGRTAQELQTALKYDRLRSDVLEDGFRKVLGAIKGNQNYTLSTANSIWIKEHFQVLSQFRNNISNIFQAEARTLNKTTAKEDINKYVANKTENMIKDFLKDNPSDDTVAILLNAIFFKGTWEVQFENKTFEAGFIDNDDEVPADASSATTRMMRIREEAFRFVDSADLKAEIVELPYQGEEASMLILLPSQGTTLVELEAALSLEKLQQATSQLRPTNVSIIMPKFKIESQLDLVEPLVRLGVKEVFTNRADLSGIGSNLTVSEVIQKAVIEVTPEGSKAAAATAVKIVPLSLPIIPDRSVRHIRVTHPFLFILKHKVTNNILFMGRYSKSAPFNKNES